MIFFRFNPARETLLRSPRFDRSHIDGTAIKILNWNIAKRNHTKAWQKDLNSLLSEYSPDLIFFQEFRVDRGLKEGVILKEMGWNFAPNFINTYTNHCFGVLTASRARNTQANPILTRVREPFLKTPKASLVTEYPLSGSQVSLAAANVHGINFVRTHQFQSQLHQLESCLARHQGPMVLSGDFNTWNSARMQLLQGMARRLNLKPVTFSPSHRLKLKRFLSSGPLDHVFYRGLEETSGSAVVLEAISSSDHKPMFVQLSAPRLAPSPPLIS